MALTGSGSFPIWERRRLQIAAGQTLELEDVSQDTLQSLQYYFVIEASDGSNRIALQYQVLNTGSGLLDQVFARIGRNLSIEVGSRLDTGRVKVEIINNESFSINLNLARLIFN